LLQLTDFRNGRAGLVVTVGDAKLAFRTGIGKTHVWEHINSEVFRRVVLVDRGRPREKGEKVDVTEYDLTGLMLAFGEWYRNGKGNEQ
jgi:hypothetical protein